MHGHLQYLSVPVHTHIAEVRESEVYHPDQEAATRASIGYNTVLLPYPTHARRRPTFYILSLPALTLQLLVQRRPYITNSLGTCLYSQKLSLAVADQGYTERALVRSRLAERNSIIDTFRVARLSVTFLFH